MLIKIRMNISAGGVNLTIAISIKINDGVVLASDSASTVHSESGVVNIYENANKIFNLCKSLPVGSITWGLGNIGNASLDTLTKDFRKELGSTINAETYQISHIAKDYSEFIYGLYMKAFAQIPDKNKPYLGLMVVGYSSKGMSAEEYITIISNGKLDGPAPVRAQEGCGITWNGEFEPITRLLLGFSNDIPQILRDYFKLDNDETNKLIELLKSRLEIFVLVPSMPIQDAIQLAEFLVDFVIKFSKFKMGPPTVGGRIEIAAITKHEGFKWVKRKHYYSEEYNPVHKKEVLNYDK